MVRHKTTIQEEHSITIDHFVYVNSLAFEAKKIDQRGDFYDAKKYLDGQKELQEFSKKYPKLRESVSKILTESNEAIKIINENVLNVSIEYSLLIEKILYEGKPTIRLTLPINHHKKDEELQNILKEAVLGNLQPVVKKKAVKENMGKSGLLCYTISANPEEIDTTILKLQRKLDNNLKDGALKKQNLICAGTYVLDSSFLKYDKPDKSDKNLEGISEKESKKTEISGKTETEKIEGKKSEEGKNYIKIKTGITKQELCDALGIQGGIINVYKTKDSAGNIVPSGKGKKYSEQALRVVIEKWNIGVYTEETVRKILGNKFDELKDSILRGVIYDGETFYLKKSVREAKKAVIRGHKAKGKQEKQEENVKAGAFVEIKPGVFLESQLAKAMGLSPSYLSVHKSTDPEIRKKLPTGRTLYDKDTLDFVIKEKGIGLYTEQEARNLVGENFEALKNKGALKGIIYDNKLYFSKKSIKKFSKKKQS